MANKKEDWEMIKKFFEDAYFTVKEGVLTKYNVWQQGNPAWLPREIKVPTSVQTIAQYAFWDVPTLEKIHLPTSVTYVDKDAFANCTKLKQIVYEGSPAEWGRVFKHPLAFASKVDVKCLKNNSKEDADGKFFDVATTKNDQNKPTNKPNVDDYFIDVETIDDNTW
jgi:hypothetical protein